jgi:hypothetical protein
VFYFEKIKKQNTFRPESSIFAEVVNIINKFKSPYAMRQSLSVDTYRGYNFKPEFVSQLYFDNREINPVRQKVIEIPQSLMRLAELSCFQYATEAANLIITKKD